MPEYIVLDPKRIPKECEGCSPCLKYGCKHVQMHTCTIREDIVRCKDCVHYKSEIRRKKEVHLCGSDMHDNSVDYMHVDPDGFCAWGERKETND